LAGKKLPVKNGNRCSPIFYRQSFTRESYSLFNHQAALSSGAAAIHPAYRVLNPKTWAPSETPVIRRDPARELGIFPWNLRDWREHDGSGAAVSG
jgi:hypothetical protein